MCDINVNKTVTDEEGQNISSAAAYFSGEQLSATDTQSTITANEAGKDAFRQSQDLVKQFGSALDKDAEHIRDLGRKFEEFDQMMAGLNKES